MRLLKNKFFLFFYIVLEDRIKSNKPFYDFIWVALWERLKFPFPNGKEPFPFCGVCPFVCLVDSLARLGLSGMCQVKTENRGVLANV